MRNLQTHTRPNTTSKSPPHKMTYGYHLYYLSLFGVIKLKCITYKCRAGNRATFLTNFSRTKQKPDMLDRFRDQNTAKLESQSASIYLP